jgi:hypothetical protein
LREIKVKVPELIGALRQIAPVTTTTISGVPQVVMQRVEQNLTRLQQRRLIKYTYGVMGIGFGLTSGGAFGPLEILIEQIVADALKRTEFD